MHIVMLCLCFLLAPARELDVSHGLATSYRHTLAYLSLPARPHIPLSDSQIPAVCLLPLPPQLLECLVSLMYSQEPAAWSHPSTMKAYRTVLQFTMDHRPKVRACDERIYGSRSPIVGHLCACQGGLCALARTQLCLDSLSHI